MNHKVPLGALVYYKAVAHSAKPAFELRTLPGVFVGWRVDAGFKYRKIFLKIDYETLKFRSKGFKKSFQMRNSELIIPGNLIFPLHQVAKNFQAVRRRYSTYSNQN